MDVGGLEVVIGEFAVAGPAYNYSQPDPGVAEYRLRMLNAFDQHRVASWVRNPQTARLKTVAAIHMFEME